MPYLPIHNWRGRKRKSQDGYVLVWVPEHPKCFGGGWYYEHRLVMELNHKRVLKDYETVHHINGDKECNELYNLFVCTRRQHMKAHK
jgi:hypothetical protein